MCLHFMSMNGVARSEEVVTEPALRVSRCISILCITLTKDEMFEIAQVLDVQKSIESSYHWFADVLHRSTILGGGIVNDNRGEQIVVLVNNFQIGESDQRLMLLDHLAITSDITYIRSKERSR